METPLPPSSSISETDFLIFRRLCNPAKVDFSQAPGTVSKLSPLPPTAAPPPYSPPKRESGTFSKAMADAARPRTPHSRKPSRQPSPPPPPPAFPATPPPNVPPSMPTPRAKEPSREPATPKEDDQHAEMQRRHILLLQLEHLKRVRGVKLSREFSMADDAESMQFELDFQENIEATSNAVAMGKMGIGIGFTGVEFLNAKFPVLNLNGLSTTACQDMDRFNLPLEQLYRKYYRRKPQNPVGQLVSLFVMSILATHIVNKGGPLAQVLLNIFWPQKRNKGGGATAATFNEFSNRGFDASVPMPPPIPPTPVPRESLRESPPAPPSSSSGQRRTMKGASYLIQNNSVVEPPRESLAPPPPPPPRESPPPPRPSGPLVLPLAGTPVRAGRLSEPPIMSLPTVTEEEGAAPDLDRATFERLMEEVSNQEEVA